MTRIRTFKPVFAAAVVLCLLFFLPGQASAIKYMSLKEALKHFIPQGASVSKVEKTIPANKMEAIKKRFDLKKAVDFNEKITPGPYTFYIGRDSAGKPLVYVLLLEQYWRTCYHKYAIGLDPDGKVKELVVVEFNCKYQYPTNKKSFLKQFTGKKAAKGGKVPCHIRLPDAKGADIDIISGATWTCDAAAIVTRRAFALYELFFAS